MSIVSSGLFSLDVRASVCFYHNMLDKITTRYENNIYHLCCFVRRHFSQQATVSSGHLPLYQSDAVLLYSLLLDVFVIVQEDIIYKQSQKINAISLCLVCTYHHFVLYRCNVYYCHFVQVPKFIQCVNTHVESNHLSFQWLPQCLLVGSSHTETGYFPCIVKVH